MANQILLPSADAAVTVFASHEPDELVRSTGLWISDAGDTLLTPGDYKATLQEKWVWLVLESGQAEILADTHPAISLKSSECCILPPILSEMTVRVSSEARLLWFTLDGTLAAVYMTRMNALLHAPAKQNALPSQLYVMKQIVQVIVRHNGTSDAVCQLQQLLWGMLASYSGQPVAMDAMLSHEIAKVVDALKASQYKSNFSLSEMAAISRMPLETFRKRFVAEVGMPPLSYLQFCKIERAKALLRENRSVREVGIEVGMQDPYHFSKQFKHIVGMSPSAYIKQVNGNKKVAPRKRRTRQEMEADRLKAEEEKRKKAKK